METIYVLKILRVSPIGHLVAHLNMVIRVPYVQSMIALYSRSYMRMFNVFHIFKFYFVIPMFDISHPLYICPVMVDYYFLNNFYNFIGLVTIKKISSLKISPLLSPTMVDSPNIISTLPSLVFYYIIFLYIIFLKMVTIFGINIFVSLLNMVKMLVLGLIFPTL